METALWRVFCRSGGTNKRQKRFVAAVIGGCGCSVCEVNKLL